MYIWLRAPRVRSLDRRRFSRLEAKPLLEPNEQPELATSQTVLRQTESTDRLIVLVSCTCLCRRSPSITPAHPQAAISILCGCPIFGEHFRHLLSVPAKAQTSALREPGSLPGTTKLSRPRLRFLESMPFPQY